jgi:hypothetical protein
VVRSARLSKCAFKERLETEITSGRLGLMLVSLFIMTTIYHYDYMIKKLSFLGGPLPREPNTTGGKKQMKEILDIKEVRAKDN